ncbi:MAG: hypothetical protein KA239_05545 [Bacteroidia bacterium]|jgi:hypothetical protein|nr:hypothetical protein [Bacteroidia bacterium]
MKSSADKDRKRNPVKVQTPEHDLPGRIMAPPPFALDASTDVPRKKREEEEEILGEEKEKGS